MFRKVKLIPTFVLPSLPLIDKRFVIVCLLLIIVAVTAALRSLTVSKQHLFPVNDEVAFLDLAREFKEIGNPSAIIKNYFNGNIKDDKRNPLYLILGSMFVDFSPTDFTRLKLLTLANVLLLIFVVFWVSSRIWGLSIGVIAGSLIAMSPATIDLSHQILVDVLYAIFYFLSFFILAKNPFKKQTWFIFGLAAGFAFLTKGSGYLIIPIGFVFGIWKMRMAFFKKPYFYLALGGFALIASFLLIRNTIVFHNPVYHFNNKIFWLDRWEQFYFLFDTPEWDKIGLSWYFSHHTVFQAFVRLIRGMQTNLVIFIYSMSVGPAWPWFRVISGLMTLGLGLYGFLVAWRQGARDLVFLVVSSSLSFFLLFSFAVESPSRYFLPLVVTLIPFSVLGAREMLSSLKKQNRYALIAVVLFVPFLFSVREIEWPLSRPLDYWQVPDYWSETTNWLHKHIGKDGYLSANWSLFSNWETGRDNVISFPFEVPERILHQEIEKRGIRFALVDQQISRFDPFQEKYGPVDQFGPMSFLDWPRCFHDHNAPSYFLIYSPLCRDGMKVEHMDGSANRP